MEEDEKQLIERLRVILTSGKPVLLEEVVLPEPLREAISALEKELLHYL